MKFVFTVNAINVHSERPMNNVRSQWQHHHHLLDVTSEVTALISNLNISYPTANQIPSSIKNEQHETCILCIGN